MLRKNWGRVIFISSDSALQIPAEMIHYGMTKTAQLALARGLAESVAGTGVTVNSVLPGPTSSEGATSFVQDVARRQGVSVAEIEKQFFATVRPSSLLKRFETPEEVAACRRLRGQRRKAPLSMVPRSAPKAASSAASSDRFNYARRWSARQLCTNCLMALPSVRLSLRTLRASAGSSASLANRKATN